MIKRDFMPCQFTLAPQVTGGIVTRDNRAMVQAFYARRVHLVGAAALVTGNDLIRVRMSPALAFQCSFNAVFYLIATIAAAHLCNSGGVSPQALILRAFRGGVRCIALTLLSGTARFAMAMLLTIELTLRFSHSAGSTNARRIGWYVALQHKRALSRMFSDKLRVRFSRDNSASTGFAIRARRSVLPRKLVYGFSLPTFCANASIPLLPNVAFRAGRLSHGNPPCRLTALFTPGHTLIKRFVLVREGVYRFAQLALWAGFNLKKIAHTSIILRINALVNARHYVATNGGRLCLT